MARISNTKHLSKKNSVSINTNILLHSEGSKPVSNALKITLISLIKSFFFKWKSMGEFLKKFSKHKLQTNKQLQ